MIILRRSRVRQGVHSGVIVDRSSATPGRDHTYSVQINVRGGDPLVLESVSPHPSLRWSSVDPTLLLVPFEIGTPVTIHVMGPDHDVRAYIETSELPDMGPCPTGGD